ncbi:hypothetical protein M404DRAFT_31414 [Pisolithus tinctorius Marx 270]|uniref:Zn(2)-C6 fungal-type domain-containing protein n=1 Tax=Pisolithus tinctorius Marx 270 TaxID=870435 RepID=A0A0C3NT55_PISTI|nr:hypothetical protein M404DRAFT_31414 [Pisolithus tinctorius Marx 270]
MSANHAPQLSQLIHVPTLDPAEAERVSLREQLVAASAGLVAEAKCVPDDQEDMWEEKTMWLRRWEEKTPACKQSQQTIAESDKEPTQSKIHIPAMGMITHKEPWMQCALKRISCTGMLGKTCNACTKIKQGCEKSSKAAGKKAQAGASVARSTKAPKAGPSKWDHDSDDDNIMEVVKSRACGNVLTMVRAKAMASHAATMCLQVCVDQLTEVLEELGIE